MNISNQWRVSLHGGHCGEFCDHGHGTLREVIEAAIEFGYHTYGIDEHAPRSEARFLFPEEVALGWTVEKIHADFERYARTLAELADEFADKIAILRGFEAEVVPHSRYKDLMTDLRRKYASDYIVGSVHWVDDIIIDYNDTEYKRAAEACGGVEALNIRYYEALAEMVGSLRPEIVGHFDVIRKFASPGDPVDTPAVVHAAENALRVIKDNGCILDINTAPYRKGKKEPYPGEWIISAVRQLDIPVCFGDDSHGPSDVGGGIMQAREFLLQHEFRQLTYLTRNGHGHGLLHKTAQLEH